MDNQEIIETASDNFENIKCSIKSQNLCKRLLLRKNVNRNCSPLSKSKKILILGRESFSAVKFVLPGTSIEKPKIIIHE